MRMFRWKGRDGSGSGISGRIEMTASVNWYSDVRHDASNRLPRISRSLTAPLSYQ